MATPDFQTLMLPVLRQLSSGGEQAPASVRAEVALIFKLSDEELATLLPSGRQTTFANRLAWALGYLKQAGLVESPRHGMYRVMARGNVTPVPRRQLLERVRQVSPKFFDKLVVELLVAMGYGGSREDAAAMVGQDGDEGIDKIIKEDRLGLDTIYIQAKRWKDNVGRPEIQRSAGAFRFGSLQGALSQRLRARDLTGYCNCRRAIEIGSRLLRATSTSCRLARSFRRCNGDVAWRLLSARPHIESGPI